MQTKTEMNKFFAEISKLKNSSDKRPCLILGNGYNLHMCKKNGKDPENYKWGKLLSSIAGKKYLRGDTTALIQDESIAYTEIADFIEAGLSQGDVFEKIVADAVRKKYNFKFCKDDRCGLLQYARENNFHILTTNFDENIESYYLSVCGEKTKQYSIPGQPNNPQKRKEDAIRCETSEDGRKNQIHNILFPRVSFHWNCFSGDEKQPEINCNANVHDLNHDIWHVHGRLNKGNSKSILFTSTKYASAINHYRRLGGYRSDNPKISNTWIKLFFECPLIIAGVGFGLQETFLRYLILQRFLHNIRSGKNNRVSTKSFYLCSDEFGKNDGRAFLREAGIVPVIFPDIHSIYEAGEYTK